VQGVEVGMKLAAQVVCAVSVVTTLTLVKAAVVGAREVGHRAWAVTR
jgi:hypothetical protein